MEVAKCTITTKIANGYIGVYDDATTYTPSQARAYCYNNFGHTLATIHSSSDETDFINAIPDTSILYTLIGLTRFSSSGSLSWQDFSTYDYDITWALGEPDGSGTCVSYSLTETGGAGFYDTLCYDLNQFVCDFGTIGITETIVGNYVGIYNDMKAYTAEEADNYCLSNYGTHLASIHSIEDESAVISTIITDSSGAWIGLNDIENESGLDRSLDAGWEYTDGTQYDYLINWGPLPSVGAGGWGDCVAYQQFSDWLTGFYDGYCTNANTQFVCNYDPSIACNNGGSASFSYTPTVLSSDYGNAEVMGSGWIASDGSNFGCTGNRYFDGEYCIGINLEAPSITGCEAITNVKLTVSGYLRYPGVANTQFTTFSVNNEYLTLVNDWDSNGANYPLDDGGVMIAPACGSNELYTTDDIMTLLDTPGSLSSFFGDIAGGDPDNYQVLSTLYNGDTSPVVIELANNVLGDKMDVSISSATLGTVECTYDTSFNKDESGQMWVFFTPFFGPATLAFTQINVDLTWIGMFFLSCSLFFISFFQTPAVGFDIFDTFFLRFLTSVLKKQKNTQEERARLAVILYYVFVFCLSSLIFRHVQP